MFTGLVEAIGTISVLRPKAGGWEVAISCAALTGDGLKPGDSIAVDGACLTAEKVESERFWARVTPQTAKTTTLSDRRTGAKVNLERALEVGQRLGGHFVLGHVDGTASVSSVERQGEAWLMGVEFPAALGKYIVPKGSVCLDGVSLTVAELSGNRLTVSLVKETLERTTLGEAAPGRKMNLEVDILAKHVAALLESWADNAEKAAGHPSASLRINSNPALQELLASIQTED